MCESLGQLKSRIGDYFGQVLDDLPVVCVQHLKLWCDFGTLWINFIITPIFWLYNLFHTQITNFSSPITSIRTPISTCADMLVQMLDSPCIENWVRLSSLRTSNKVKSAHYHRTKYWSTWKATGLDTQTEDVFWWCIVLMFCKTVTVTRWSN